MQIIAYLLLLNMCVLVTMLMSREAGPKSGITNSSGETVASFCENPYTCSDVFCYHASSYMDNSKIVLALLFQK